eukprot:scaffold6711_cov118-Isochrysis_galbana.AAC.29
MARPRIALECLHASRLHGTAAGMSAAAHTRTQAPNGALPSCRCVWFARGADFWTREDYRPNGRPPSRRLRLAGSAVATCIDTMRAGRQTR